MELTFFLQLVIIIGMQTMLMKTSRFKAHVINIPHRTDRLHSITTQLKKFDIPYEIFRAITPTDIARECGKRTNRFDPETKYIFRPYMLRIRTPRKTEVACFQSHLQILLKHAKSNTNDTILVLEDDALLDPDFYNKTVQIMDEIKGRWDILHLGYCYEPNDMCDPNGEIATNFCKMKKQSLLCAHAYLINGSSAARTITNHINTPRGAIFDLVLGYATDYYYISLPKLAKQLPFSSDNGNDITIWE